MQTANFDREFLHIFWTASGNSITFSGKLCFKIILKITKSQGSTLSIENTFFKKPQGRINLTPSPPSLRQIRVNQERSSSDSLKIYFCFLHFQWWFKFLEREFIWLKKVSFIKKIRISKVKRFLKSNHDSRFRKKWSFNLKN